MTFDLVFERVIGHEGGYSDDPKDPGNWTGGRVGVGQLKGTKYGISAASYPLWDIKNLTLEQAKYIYKKDFWTRINADMLHDGVAYQLFDFAVNSGCQTAIRYFQRALGVADDGLWGPVSQHAVDNSTESDMIMSLCAERLEYMTKLKNWPVAGKGWARRIANNLRYGVEDSD
jgi:lysozyme family protein